jgi:hypothetical protein
MKIRLTQIDGALPNLALMKLSHWHKSQGHSVHLTRHILPDLFEGSYDRVYGSAIFAFSKDRIEMFRREWPKALLGGTGTGNWQTVEELIGAESYEHYDYSGYPDFPASIGFTQRGCRLSCKFCVVPKKEGKPKSVNTITDIWRGEPYPKHLHILDNDFFGQPRDQWQARLDEIRSGKFKVCLSQGINARLIDDEAAFALSTIDYRDTQFKNKRLYTAWDNLGDEKIFFAGVDRLDRAGIPPKHLMVYMLIGYDKRETWDTIWHRFNRMIDRGVEPYPMVYDRSRKDLLCFQRWVIAGLYRFVPWGDYERETKSEGSVISWRATLPDALRSQGESK